MDEGGKAVRRAESYGNDPDGWAALHHDIREVANRIGAVQTVCGMEATSNMHKRLEQALRAQKASGLVVQVLNPRSVRYFAKAQLRDTKTDRLDSRNIADYLLRMPCQAGVELGQEVEEFREFVRMRRSLVEERTQQKNRLHRLLRYYFPGYRKVLGGKTAITKGLLVVLGQMPSPDQILSRGVDELALLETGPRHRLGRSLSTKLERLSAQAPVKELSPLTQKIISTTARRIQELEGIILEMEQALAGEINRLFPDNVIDSIQGVALVTTSTCLAEIGDITRFADKRRFVGYVGLYPIIWESGQSRKSYRMTRKGNRMLKMALLLASVSVRRCNPVFKAYYDGLLARGKSKKAAGGAVARKLAELIYTLMIRKERWSLEKGLRGLERSEQMRGVKTEEREPRASLEKSSQTLKACGLDRGPEAPAQPAYSNGQAVTTRSPEPPPEGTRPPIARDCGKLVARSPGSRAAQPASGASEPLTQASTTRHSQKRWASGPNARTEKGGLTEKLKNTP